MTPILSLTFAPPRDVYKRQELCRSDSSEYPRRQLNAFAQGLLNWDVDEIQAQLADLVRTIRSGKLSLQQVKCVCMELSTSFMREVHNLNNSHPFRTERFDIFHICEYDSIDELVQHISELSASIKQYLESSETLCQDSDIHRCLALLDDRFDDCQFSLESLYDQDVYKRQADDIAFLVPVIVHSRRRVQR